MAVRGGSSGGLAHRLRLYRHSRRRSESAPERCHESGLHNAGQQIDMGLSAKPGTADMLNCVNPVDESGAQTFDLVLSLSGPNGVVRDDLYALIERRPRFRGRGHGFHHNPAVGGEEIPRIFAPRIVKTQEQLHSTCFRRLVQRYVPIRKPENSLPIVSGPLNKTVMYSAVVIHPVSPGGMGGIMCYLVRSPLPQAERDIGTDELRGLFLEQESIVRKILS